MRPSRPNARTRRRPAPAATSIRVRPTPSSARARFFRPKRSTPKAGAVPGPRKSDTQPYNQIHRRPPMQSLDQALPATGMDIVTGAGDRGRRIRAIVGASSGNLVEWYDFYAYAFTSIYFAAAFFPTGDSTSQLMATAGIFAVGFFMRPLGGWLFGWIADAHGRKNSMVLSVLLMCAGSLMIGILPTYQTVGAAAPVLLLFARMAQGLSVGGEYGTAATYMSEIAGKGNRGFYSSFQYVTLIGGQLLALLVLVMLQALLSVDEIKSWGWRIPFIIGAATAVVAMYLRRSLVETGSQEAMHSKEAGSL